MECKHDVEGMSLDERYDLRCFLGFDELGVVALNLVEKLGS
jgi:hypothetical protein